MKKKHSTYFIERYLRYLLIFWPFIVCRDMDVTTGHWSVYWPISIDSPSKQQYNSNGSQRRPFGTSIYIYIPRQLVSNVQREYNYCPYPSISISVVAYSGPLTICTFVRCPPRTPVIDLINSLQVLNDKPDTPAYILSGDFNG